MKKTFVFSIFTSAASGTVLFSLVQNTVVLCDAVAYNTVLFSSHCRRKTASVSKSFLY